MHKLLIIITAIACGLLVTGADSPKQRVATKVVASALIYNEAGQLLSLQRARNYSEIASGKGMWEFPGGKVELGETIRDALDREVADETGLTNLQWQVVENSNFVIENDGQTSHRFHLWYRATISGKPVLKLSEEHTKSQWSNASEISRFKMLPEYREFALSHWPPSS